MAAALGGGATEAAFGADTSNVLVRLTIKFSIAFFILTFLLYLANIRISSQNAEMDAPSGTLPSIDLPAAQPSAQAPAPSATPTQAPVSEPASASSPASPAPEAAPTTR